MLARKVDLFWSKIVLGPVFVWGTPNKSLPVAVFN